MVDGGGAVAETRKGKRGIFALGGESGCRVVSFDEAVAATRRVFFFLCVLVGRRAATGFNSRAPSASIFCSPLCRLIGDGLRDKCWQNLERGS